MTICFMDCEFTGLHQNTTLISLGIVSECGKTFYAELRDYDKSQVDKWLQNNVIANLRSQQPDFNDSILGENIGGDNEFHYTYKDGVKVFLSSWLSQFDQVEIWGDCLAYDWVLFNNIFGSAFDIPKNVYYLPFDIVTMFKLYGINPDISREEFINNSVDDVKHNALYDAKVIKACYEKLTAFGDGL